MDDNHQFSEDEIAAESVRDQHTTRIKVVAFVFQTIITASIAGSLQAGFVVSVVPKVYTFINSINVLDYLRD